MATQTSPCQIANARTVAPTSTLVVDPRWTSATSVPRATAQVPPVAMPTDGTTPPSPAPSSVAERSTARTAIGDTAYTTPSTTVSALTSGATPTRLPTRPSRSTRTAVSPSSSTHARPLLSTTGAAPLGTPSVTTISGAPR